MSFMRQIFQRATTLAPEPSPDLAQITRHELPPVVREFASKDGRFIILISLDADGFYRGHGFTWFTHADDTWMAFWQQHDFGTYTKDTDIILGEAQRRLEIYDRERDHVA
jgi:hypothetical protein